MKSDVCTISNEKDSLISLLEETEKAASYINLDKKQTGRLRLLAEELVEMLPELLSFSSGTFWIEATEKTVELHTSLIPDEALSENRREKLISISSTGKNEEAKGIMNKIIRATEFMLIDYEQVASVMPAFYSDGIGTDFALGEQLWSLDFYREKIKEQKNDSWDELERSIIANIADDVLVGIKGKNVSIVVRKTFN